MAEHYPTVVIGAGSKPEPESSTAEAPRPEAESERPATVAPRPVAEARSAPRYDGPEIPVKKSRKSMGRSTLIDIFDEVVARPRLDLLRCKKGGSWSDISTGEFGASVRRLAAFLVDFGAKPGDRLALMSENRPEWTIADFAIQMSGSVTVPIYTSLSPEQIAALIADCKPRAILVSKYDLFKKLIAASRLLKQRLQVLVFDPFPAGLSAANEPAEVAFLSEAYVHGGRCLLSKPDLLESRIRAIDPDDVASIIYTSGTTGEPRGVMLTHANFCSNIDACLKILPLGQEDVALSFLPLSHVFERVAEYLYLTAGGSIAYAESMEKVSANLLEVRPTVLACVPRVLEKMRERILDSVRTESWIKRRIFFWSLRVGRRRIRRLESGQSILGGGSPSLRLADRLVHAKIRERLGGRIRYMVSGGAPLPREHAEFFTAAGLAIMEGYGLTEASPVISVNGPANVRLGTVGQVLPGVGVRIDDDGEILVTGPNIMKGYFQNPEATREIMRGPYLATGDIGTLDAQGYLTITDRKKDLIITSGGKNVPPQPIENALKTSRYIANALLVGDKRHFIGALIVPDFSAIRRLAGARGWGDLSPQEMSRHPGVRGIIETEIDSATRSFAQFEKIKKFALLERDFAAEENEITPTLKVRRRVVLEHFAPVIEALYSSTS